MQQAIHSVYKYSVNINVKANLFLFAPASSFNPRLLQLTRYYTIFKPRKTWRETPVFLSDFKMPQKQITSFFAKRVYTEKSDEIKSEIQSKDDTEDSPIKTKSKKRKRSISDSEDEDTSQRIEKPMEEVKVEQNSSSPSSAGESKKEVKKESKPKIGKKRKKTPVNKKTPAKKTKLASVKKENEVKSEPLEEKANEINEQEVKMNGNDTSKTSPKAPSKDSSDAKSSPINDMAFNPAAVKYHPIENSLWKRGEKVPYLALAKTLEAIENTSARLKIIEILSNFFRSVIILTPEDLLPSVYLCLNELAPAYEGIELGVGDMLLKKAIAQSTGRTMDKLKAEVDAKGDLGLVAESCRSNQNTMFKLPPLTVRGVFVKLKEIAKMTGNASSAKKIEQIQKMLVASRSTEARYLVRLLSGKLRIGLAEQSVLAALSQAALLTPPGQEYPPEVIDASKKLSNDVFKKKLEEHTLIIKTTFSECPSYDKIIDVLLKHGVDALPKHCYITPGIPLKPMLAHPTKGVQEVLHRFENAQFTCEYKYDGERAQIHVLEDGKIHIYSRNQENNTSKYPDIISRIPRTLKEGTKSCIIDTEAVAWDIEKKQILPFQILSTRKKKDANEAEIKVRVCVYAFDLLYLNGESLVKKPFKERRELLHSSFTEIENEFQFVHFLNSDNTEEIAVFLEEAVKGNCEGLMVKTLDVDATYEIAKRSHNWLKLKKDYLDGVGDTLDLVVLGGYHGKGKRTGSYGGFLLACYDEQNEEFQSICRLGTGFKDEELEKHNSFFKDHIIPQAKSYYRYDSSLAPDEWFEPVQVWEIKCADLSVSPVHKAGLGLVEDDKGISLRFPRFLRIRDDKSPENATSAVEVVKLYRNQDQVKNQSSGQVPAYDIEEEY